MNDKNLWLPYPDRGGFHYDQEFTYNELFALIKAPYFTQAHKKMVKEAEKDFGLAISTVLVCTEKI